MRGGNLSGLIECIVNPNNAFPGTARAPAASLQIFLGDFAHSHFFPQYDARLLRAHIRLHGRFFVHEGINPSPRCREKIVDQTLLVLGKDCVE